MAELLKQAGVKEYVRQMAPYTLEWFKMRLVVDGIYARYAKERKAGR